MLIFNRASDGFYCKGTSYETSTVPLALVDISCGVMTLYTKDCPGKLSGCGHGYDVCFVCESMYQETVLLQLSCINPNNPWTTLPVSLDIKC